MTVISSNSNTKSQGSGVSIGNGKSLIPGRKGSKPEDYVTDITWIVTNAHVITSDKNTVIKYKNSDYPVEIKYIDRNYDLAILLVKGIAISSAKFSNKNYKVGEEVFAIGSPLGLENTMSDGIISSIRRLDQVPLFQTTSAISHGNSGGGLFDADGYLIGITTFKIKGGENLNFAIDARFAENLFGAIISADVLEVSQKMSRDEKYQLANWLAVTKSPSGVLMYKYYLDEFMKFSVEDDDASINFDKEIMDKFRSSAFLVKNSKSSTEFSAKNIMLICEISSGKKTSYMNVEVDLENSTINNHPAIITDTEFRFKKIIINRFTGILDMISGEYSFQGKCDKASERAF